MPRTRTFDEQEVLDRIFPLFKEKGYHQTSLDDILKAAGIARQSLYNTYGDKRRLFLRVLAAYRGNLAAATETRVRLDLEAGRPIHEILRWLVFAGDAELGVGGSLTANTMAEFHQDDAEVREEVDALFIFLRKTLRMLLRLGQKRGEITLSLTAEKMAEVLLNAGIGLRIGKEHRLDVKSLENAAEWTVELVRVRREAE